MSRTRPPLTETQVATTAPPDLLRLSEFCNRDSCWLEPGHDGECRPGGCWHAGREA